MAAFLATAADYLVRQSWQIAAVFVLVAAVCWGLRRKSAHWRYLLWLVVLAKCLTPAPIAVPLPVLPATASRAEIPSSSAHLERYRDFPALPTDAEAAPAIDDGRAVAAAATISPSELAAPANPAGTAAAMILSDFTWQAWLALAWLAGVGLFWGCVSVKAWATHRTLREARRPIDGETATTVAALAQELGMRTIPPVYVVDGAAQPFVWGWLRGSIYLPQLFLTSGTCEQRQAILAHELAHVARWDAAVNLVQILVQGAFFFHPLVWLANRQIRREREKCCDEIVIAGLGTAPKLYGEAIVNVLVTEYQATSAASSLAVSGQLNNIEQRIRTILSPDRRFCRRPSGRAIVTAVLAAATALPTALVLTAREGSADFESAGVARPASAPAGSAAQGADNAVKPKESGASGRTAAKKPESDKKPLEALVYTGQVTDKLNGKPIAGASVTVLRRVSSRSIGFSEWRKLGETKHQTDAIGRYTFTIPPEQVAEERLYLEFTVTHANYVRYYGGYSFNMIRKNETIGGRPFFENLILEPAARLSGTVVTPDGKPAKGARIKGFSLPDRRDLNRSAWAETTTNEAGFFEFNVNQGGEAILWILPNDYAPSTHVLHAKRGDLGRFVLEKGLVLKGRVVDTEGKPLKNVWVNAEIRGGPAKQKIDLPVVDYLARSALSDERGEFAMAPLPAGDYNLRMSERPRSGSDGVFHRLPAVFITQEITLDQRRSTQPIEVRAVPHVLITGQFFDSSGKPTSGFAPDLSAHSNDSGRSRWFWATAQIGEQGKFTVKSPKGFAATLNIIDNEHHAIKTRISKNAPLNNGRTLELGVLDQDMTEVAIIRYVAPILLVKAVGEDGRPMREFRPSIVFKRDGMERGGQFPRNEKPVGYVSFERQDDGRQRSSQLLPDVEFTVTVDAPGHEPQSESLNLPEGAVKELEVRLKKASQPGTSAKGNSRASPQKPPVAATPLMKKDGPGRAIACRAIDVVTGKPVAGAAVTILVRQSKDEKGQSAFKDLEADTTTTDTQGQFTVFVPQEYLADLDSKREVDLFVTASHASYITGFGFGHPRQIARKGLTDTSADLRLLQLEPAKEIYGQAVDAKGRPLAKTYVYKSYFEIRNGGYFLAGKKEPRDFDSSFYTDKDGHFRTRVSARAAVCLEFRSPDVARNSLSVPVDRTDLGVIRIPDGVRVTGRVVDEQGRPVPRIMVTTPLQSKTEGQPNNCYYTDKDGRFQTSKLSPGDYLFTVGCVYGSEDGARDPLADAPGVYVPRLLKIRAEEPVAELMLQPRQDVARCVVTLVSTRPRPAALNSVGLNDEMEQRLSREVFFSVPSIIVHGFADGIAWEGAAPLSRRVAQRVRESTTRSETPRRQNPCMLRVPKGLTDVTVHFGIWPQHFQLDDKSPKLFGFGVHLDRIDRDLPGIKIYRYRETTLQVQAEGADGKALANVQVQAHYVREKAVRDAGAILASGSLPFLKPEGKDGNVSYSVLPGEEIEVSATAPGRETAVARVQLKDGEVRELRMKPKVAP